MGIAIDNLPSSAFALMTFSWLTKNASKVVFLGFVGIPREQNLIEPVELRRFIKPASRITLPAKACDQEKMMSLLNSVSACNGVVVTSRLLCTCWAEAMSKDSSSG